MLSGTDCNRACLGFAVAALLFAASAAAAGAASWPGTKLGADAAVSVDSRQFVSSDQLRDWQVDLDQRGMRAAGSPAHEKYVAELARRLRRAGVTQLRFESTPLQRWSVDHWALDVVDGPQAGSVDTAAYVPYSGATPASGITRALVQVAAGAEPDAAIVGGKIAVFDLPDVPVRMDFFLARALRRYDPQNLLAPTDPYRRTHFALASLVSTLDQLEAAGAAGAVVVINAPAATAQGFYAPYDRKLRKVPAVFVDRQRGEQLRALAANGGRVKLTLAAQIAEVRTRNLVGIIPGASGELTVINSHTDGTNGLEDNGPNAIVAIAQYLARLPRQSLPRSVMILLTTGHFAGGIGAEDFIARHRGDGMTARIASLLTIEHLGAQEWLPDAQGLLAPTGRNEVAALFTPPVPALVDAAEAMLKNSGAAPAFVMPPLHPQASGSSNEAVWPGEGQYFWGQARIPTVNYITGPTYLLNWGVGTADKVDYGLMRRETVAFTQMLLDLSRVPMKDLREDQP